MPDTPGDTTREAAAHWHALIAALDGSTRVRMATDMFESALALVESSVRAAAGGASEGAIRARVFEQLYPDLDDATRRAVSARILAEARGE